MIVGRGVIIGSSLTSLIPRSQVRDAQYMGRGPMVSENNGFGNNDINSITAL